MQQILVVDNEEIVVEALSNVLKEHGYKCKTTMEPFAALDVIKVDNVFRSREKREIATAVQSMMGPGTQIAQPIDGAVDIAINSLASALNQTLYIVAKLVGVHEAQNEVERRSSISYSKMVIEHSKRVAISAANAAKNMKLPSDECEQIVSAALLLEAGRPTE